MADHQKRKDVAYVQCIQVLAKRLKAHAVQDYLSHWHAVYIFHLSSQYLLPPVLTIVLETATVISNPFPLEPNVETFVIDLY